MSKRVPTSSGNFFGSIAGIFKPPFEGLWLIVLIYYAWCFLVYPRSQVLRGNFPDPDDYMYAVQVMDWMKGAAWFDHVQQRLNPPDGIIIHFSRLAMIPMAAMTWVFERCGLGPRGAVMLMAGFYPLLLLGGFLVTMRRVGLSFISKGWAGISSYVVLFTSTLVYMFQPYHIDHHGLVIWIIAGTLGLAMKMMERPDKIWSGLACGLLLALGLTIALETLPWLIIIAGWLGLWSAVKGGPAARNGLAFALSLHVFSLFFLALTRPPSDFFTTDLLTFSVVYVILTGGIAVSFAAVAIFAETKLFVRIIAGTIMGAISGFLFLHQFPDLIAGPYGAMDPELQALILDSVSEAAPLTARFRNPFILALFLAPTLLALLAGAYFFFESRNVRRWTWGLWITTLLAAFLLSTFYQCRYEGTMGMLSVLPLALLIERGMAYAGTRLKDRPRFFAEAGLLFVVGPGLSLFLPALVDGRSFNTGILLFPVTGSHDNICDTFELERVLRDPAGLGNRPRLIMNDMGIGPELLYRTNHSALAAPFLDTEGNMDSYRFFSTLYPAEAKAIARRRHIDLVVSCVAIPVTYLRSVISQSDLDVKKDIAPHFIEMLNAGRAPFWLKRVKSPHLQNFAVYEVLSDEAETEASKAFGGPKETAPLPLSPLPTDQAPGLSPGFLAPIGPAKSSLPGSSVVLPPTEAGK